MKTKGWTDERRAKRAADCKEAKPWAKSTGPKTQEGKEISAQNAYKHGGRDKAMRDLENLLALQNQFLKKLSLTNGKTSLHK